MTYAGTIIGTYTGGTGSSNLVHHLQRQRHAGGGDGGASRHHLRQHRRHADASRRTIPLRADDGDGGASTNCDTTVTVKAAPSVSMSPPLVFTADDGTHGNELWITDGTAAGTNLVKDIYSGASDSMPYGFTALGNGKFLFQADDEVNGCDLVTSGTA